MLLIPFLLMIISGFMCYLFYTKLEDSYLSEDKDSVKRSFWLAVAWGVNIGINLNTFINGLVTGG